MPAPITPAQKRLAARLRELWWEGVLYGYQLGAAGADQPDMLSFGWWDDDDADEQIIATFNGIKTGYKV